ncbi:hypothetical protein HUG15_19795 [Salicibibacter cibarius]|uniref:Uncharacterized protein n=1 Tax=Salicibibacter cibarius TaxID=2743000 RepID=A0A7T6Z677_9BACI|nr:hypothetical protein HUG15_19795 [Salicibibacter cibarius]
MPFENAINALDNVAAFDTLSISEAHTLVLYDPLFRTVTLDDFPVDVLHY